MLIMRTTQRQKKVKNAGVLLIYWKMKKMSEHDIQKAITNYLDLKNICYFAVPNGGHRHMLVAKKLKAEGVKAGVPDLAIVHNGKYYGIEVKTPKGRLSENQKLMITLLENNGASVGIVRGISDTAELLNEWGIR